MKFRAGRIRHKKLAITGLIGCGVVIVGFLTWLTISALTVDTNLELAVKYTLLEFAGLEALPGLDGAEYAVAIDGEVAAKRGEVSVLDGEPGVATPRPTASTAKMILGLAIMQAKPFELGTTGETITLTTEDYNLYNWYLSRNGSNMPVTVGEEISEYDALMATFLVSANNMADSLAVWAFGSLDNYREYASKMLAEWGITNTTVGVDASGFDASTTSTPADLARIGAKVLENPVLAEIVGTKEYVLPIVGTVKNTNKLLGTNGIVGVKTGYIGDASGYCLVTGYRTGEHIVTVALINAPTRAESFDESLNVVAKAQELVSEQKIVTAGETVGYYDSWWTGQVAIRAKEDLMGLGWRGAETKVDLEMNGAEGELKVKIGSQEYQVKVAADEYAVEPSLGDKLGHVFGWRNENKLAEETPTATGPEQESKTEGEDSAAAEEPKAEAAAPETAATAFTNAPSQNCTIKYGSLMLINPNFTVENTFIAARRGELVSISAKYGIVEGNAYNGDNLLDAEAAEHINEMINAYKAAYPGHTMETRSCFRAVGTSCGRLCAATGTSDHHTGLTCDLLDPAYGTSLDTSTYGAHPDW